MTSHNLRVVTSIQLFHLREFYTPKLKHRFLGLHNSAHYLSTNSIKKALKKQHHHKHGWEIYSSYESWIQNKQPTAGRQNYERGNYQWRPNLFLQGCKKICPMCDLLPCHRGYSRISCCCRHCSTSYFLFEHQCTYFNIHKCGNQNIYTLKRT